MTYRLLSTATLLAALGAISACTSIPFEASQGAVASRASSGRCDAMGDWFERQRALTDGNVDPQKAAFDPTCRAARSGA